MNEKLNVLLNEILVQINNFELTEAEFDQAKKEQLEDYNNNFIKPKRLAVDICSKLTVEGYESLFETIEWVKQLTYSQFKELIKSIWSETYVQAHVQGNFTNDEAKDMFNNVVQKLKCTGTRALMKADKIKQVKEPVCLKFENFNKTDGNRYFIMSR